MNPYAPPEASVHDEPLRPGSAFKAIAVGLVVDIGGSLIGTVLLALVYAAALGAAGVKHEDIAATLQASNGDSLFFYAGILVGLGFSVLGGYVCARIARRAELKLGAILAALSAISGLGSAGDEPQLGLVLRLSLLGVGGLLVRRRPGLAKNRTGR